MMAISRTICPQEIAATNRKVKNRRREQNPEVRAAVKEWVKGKLCACGCGKEANMAHHPTRDLYRDSRYSDQSEWIPYYHKCHFNMHRHLVRCPVCKGWMREGNEKCAKCQGWRYRNIKVGHNRHPCGANTGSQRCSLNGVCPYNPQKAPGCRKFVVRVKKA